MKQATRFKMHQGWRLLMVDMGLNPADVLTLSGLPADLFEQKDVTLSVTDYFNLWIGLEKAAGELELPLKIAEVLSVEAFEPAIFACVCSPNLNVAMKRLQHFKRLVGPMILDVEVTPRQTHLTVTCYKYKGPIPRSVGLTELVFFTQLIRLSTRHTVVPRSVVCTAPPEDHTPYEAYFGTGLQTGERNTLSFSAEDATRPFLTENAGMWDFFEKSLNQRLSKLDHEASTSQRVKSALLELLPGGQSAIEQVAGRLAVSKRTLQRRLSHENANYQTLLNATRKDLAHHYLRHTAMAPGEISFLLGFQDTNSFVRAFKTWTGKTPGQQRAVYSA